jgi:hypothetical protein
MNKNIIIAILCVILIAAVGGFLLAQPQATTEDGKINTQLKFISKDSLQNGQNVEFELTDMRGNAIVGEPVKITYVAKGVDEKYSVVTDSQGHGYLVLSGEDAGTYDITLNYEGNSTYNGCSAKQTLTITGETSSQNNAQNTEIEKVESPTNSTANTVMYNNVSSKSSDSTSSNTTSTSEDPSHEYVSNLYYDEELGVYYDDFGTIHGGEMDGNEIGLLRALHDKPNTDEYGNPQWG